MEKNTKQTKANSQQYHSEIVDLASGGKGYSKDNPLASGKIELKYMTTKEEDILTSQNLIKQGIVIDKLLESLILTEGVDVNKMLVGDKNAVLVAARILAYGPEYNVTLNHPNTGEEIQHTFNLTDCEFRELPDDVDYSDKRFEFKTPITKDTIAWDLIDGTTEVQINKTMEAMKKKMGKESAVTTRLKSIVKSVNGDDNKLSINSYIDNMLARDALAFRREIARVSPDIVMEQEIEWEGETISVVIPMDIEFFWPKGGE
tara:strand:+ start:145 stop:924 length:780 start_codon:yes stop_codon:yes gene_type:complete